MVNELEGLRKWYNHDTGAARVKKFIFSFYDWNSILEEPRTPWQIDKWELLTRVTAACAGIGGVIGGAQGFQLAFTKYQEINKMEIYEHRAIARRQMMSWVCLGSMGYGIPMALRLSLYSSTMIGLPMMLGVYRGDQDYISHYVGAGALTGVFMANRVGWRAQVLFAPTVALVLGLPAGLVLWYLQSEYNTGNRLPFYTNRQERLAKMEPYIDFKQKLRIEEEMKKNQIADHIEDMTVSAASGSDSDSVEKESENT